MRHFFKVGTAANIPLMIQIMSKRDKLFDAEGNGLSMPEDGKKLALGMMQITNSFALQGCLLRWMDHDTKWKIERDADDLGEGRYVNIIGGQVMCMIGEECPAMNQGDIWWIDSKHDAMVINKSGDDAVLMLAIVRAEF